MTKPDHAGESELRMRERRPYQFAEGTSACGFNRNLNAAFDCEGNPFMHTRLQIYIPGNYAPRAREAHLPRTLPGSAGAAVLGLAKRPVDHPARSLAARANHGATARLRSVGFK